MTARRAQVELSVEVGSEPITGSVVVGSGQPRPFAGWMELVAAIEAARDPREPVGEVRVKEPIN